jgi:hypothetical protein
MDANLTAAAWPLLIQRFTGVDPSVTRYFARPYCQLLDDVHRTARDFLTVCPVELLVLGNMDRTSHEAWIERTPGSLHKATPKLVIEFWDPWHITRNDDGPMSKLVVTIWEKLGYDTSCISANATQVGGVVDQKWLLCVRELR